MTDYPRDAVSAAGPLRTHGKDKPGLGDPHSITSVTATATATTTTTTTAAAATTNYYYHYYYGRSTPREGSAL